MLRPSGEQWSGEATRNQGLAVEETRVDITIGEADGKADANAKRKERPVWMVESTIASNEQVSSMTQCCKNAKSGNAKSAVE